LDDAMPADPSHWAYPEQARRQITTREGVYAAYSGYADGREPNDIGAHAIVDDDYALLYARNLAAHLRRLALPEHGAILDIGCGPGTVTAALARALGAPTQGIDIDPIIVAAATRHYPQCMFAAGSADDLAGLPDRALRLVHAREFYPYSRVAAPDLHLRLLAAAAPKLVDGGLFAVVQVVDKAGLADTLARVRAGARALGYAESGRRVMIPQRAYRKLAGAVDRGGLLAWPVFLAVAILGRLLELHRSGYVTYIYWFRRRYAP
jgi:SAM-dependent methyltransferase